MRYLFIYLIYLYCIPESISQNTLINVNNVIYPNSTLVNHNITQEYNYNLQYYNNTWLNDQINYNITKNIDYDTLYHFKEYKLRYKFIKNENIYYSNYFKIAYINASYVINNLNNEILLKWNNVNFNGNNSLYLNYYYHDKIFKYENFNEININNIHIIDLNDILKKLFILNFTFVIKNNNYDIKEYLHFDHNNLTKILTNKTHTSRSYCLMNFCKNNLDKKAEICINNRNYKSFCHAFCYNENFNSIKLFNDIKKCNSTSTKLSTSSTYNTNPITPLTQLNDISISVNKVIFPYNNNFNITGISSNFSYILQYYDTIWHDTNYISNIDNPFNINYNNLLKYKKYTLRYKLIDDNIIIFSNNFNIAYIDLQYKINQINKTIDIDWNNINFISNNTLLIDYYYSNKTKYPPKLIEENIKNNHNINIMKYIEKYILYEMKFLIKSNKYNITNYIDISHDGLVKIVYDNSYSRYRLCVEKYCKTIIDKKYEVCINNKKYKSACHLICNNEYFESLDELKRCDSNNQTNNNNQTNTFIQSTIQPTLLPKTVGTSILLTQKKITPTTITTTPSTITLTPSTITATPSTITPSTITPSAITTIPSTVTSIGIPKTSIKYNNKLENYELVFTGIQSCKNNKRCENAKRFSTAKDNDHTKHLLKDDDLMVETCLIYCDNHINCKGVYIFYGLNNHFKCRTLTNLGNNNGSTTILYDYSYKYIGKREILTTQTTTDTQTLTSTQTTTDTQTLTTQTTTDTQTLTTTQTSTNTHTATDTESITDAHITTDTQTITDAYTTTNTETITNAYTTTDTHTLTKLHVTENNSSLINNLKHKNTDSKASNYIVYILLASGLVIFFIIFIFIITKKKKRRNNFKGKIDNYYNNLERPNFSNALEINNYSKLNKNKDDPNYRIYNNEIYESNIKYNIKNDQDNDADNNMENSIVLNKDLNSTTSL